MLTSLKLFTVENNVVRRMRDEDLKIKFRIASIYRTNLMYRYSVLLILRIFSKNIFSKFNSLICFIPLKTS